MSNPFDKSGGGSGVPGKLSASLAAGKANRVNPATNLPAPAEQPSVKGSLAPPSPLELQPASVSRATSSHRAPEPALQSGEEVPDTLRRQITDLETWALGNKKDSEWDAFRYWLLKIPAIIGAALAGIFAFYQWEVLPLVIGGIASACVLIDGLNPRGALRNAHYKAFYELRELQGSMVTMWRIDQHKATTPEAKAELASVIIKDSEVKKARISEDLKKAETALAN